MNKNIPISPELMAQIRRIQIQMRALVGEAFAGEYRSAFRGRGIEFEEVRPYQPGDDIRAIDWNVTARTGTPFIKLFREERELSIIFLVDASASMRFGSRSRLKSVVAAETAALLAYAAIKKSDKAGLIIFSDLVEKFIPPRKGQTHIWRMIREIIGFEGTSAKTDIGCALDHLNRIIKRRSIVFIISDFLDSGFDDALAVAAKHHDVIAITIDDPMEREIPDTGIVELRDAESGEIVELDTMDQHMMRSWADERKKERDQVLQRLRGLGVGHIPLATENSSIDPILHFFRKRSRGR